MADGSRRAKTREALMRHARIDETASAREQLGAQIGLLSMIGVVILVGALPVAEAIRIPFLTIGFVTAFVIGHSAKRWLEAWFD